MSAPMSSAPVPVVNATRFRAAYEVEWYRLDEIVTRIEKKSVRVVDADDLLALPVLYRAALSSLSVARETSLDRELVAYLEQLCTRAYFQIYGAPGDSWRQIGAFFATGWPAAVASLWRETIVSVALMLLGALAAYMLVTNDPAWFYSIVPESLAQGRDPSASQEVLREVLYSGDGEGALATFATFLFTHNSQVALFAFALGFAFAVPTAFLMLYNGLMLGAFFAIYVPKGLGVALGGWLFIHGTTELFAIAIAGAAGFRIGLAVAFPGRMRRLDSAVAAGRTGGLAMAGVVVMLLAAGLLEGIGRQTVQSDALRYAIGGTILLGWLIYFYLPRPNRERTP
ncbi:stage II sporulation protein M [Stakelama tenebrarum]|uniref:Stage II sporulation protein M n=1 Tax=Stakelama tenebrarum TaxID=2711215 RepID=A0A6G6Y6T2_9SPHN|nr:stage II sporulation protein M [Sphingosinithalassobacter tenebrarum]QIG80654.1 stage II sporulation protein M [Sphingosinithalassobacter tenebrarum]